MSAPADTGMRLYLGEGWPVLADTKPGYDGRPIATLRRIGWLDQKGRVWTKVPSISDFDGGSLTPLLIDPREDGH